VYPYLGGRAATLTLATVMSDRDVKDAAARTSLHCETDRARRAARRGADRSGHLPAGARRRWSLSPGARLLASPQATARGSLRRTVGATVKAFIMTPERLERRRPTPPRS
jgi:hypothetical protein